MTVNWNEAVLNYWTAFELLREREGNIVIFDATLWWMKSRNVSSIYLIFFILHPSKKKQPAAPASQIHSRMSNTLSWTQYSTLTWPTASLALTFNLKCLVKVPTDKTRAVISFKTPFPFDFKRCAFYFQLWWDWSISQQYQTRRNVTCVFTVENYGCLMRPSLRLFHFMPSDCRKLMREGVAARGCCGPIPTRNGIAPSIKWF